MKRLVLSVLFVSLLVLFSTLVFAQSHDWLNDEQGLCPQTSCFLESDPLVGINISTDQQVSTCKPSGWYSRETSIPGVTKNFSSSVADIYCDNGEWKSRTSFVAQKMMQIPGNEFTLVCGKHDRVLVDGSFGDFVVPQGEFTNSVDMSVFNNLCILSYEDNLVIGSTFNEFGDYVTSPSQINLHEAALQAFGVDVDFTACSVSGSVYVFRRCQSSDGWFYFNNFTQSFIYSPTNDALRQGTALRLYDLFISPILGFLGITQRGPLEVSPERLRFSTLFNYIYWSKSGSKEILAVSEAKKTSALYVEELIAINFHNFDSNICSTVDSWDETHPQRGRETIICQKDVDNQVVTTTLGSSNPFQQVTSFDFIEELMMGTRLR